MKYHKQLSLYTAGDLTNKRGSCLQTAIACILDLELDEVPPFHLFYWSEEEDLLLQKFTKEKYHGEDHQRRMYETAYSFWHHALTFFLYSKGVVMEQLYEGEKVVEDYDINKWLENNKGVIYTASGLSSRGVSHIVIYQDGKMIHDPHPSNEGLVEVKYYTIYNKIK